MDFHTGCLRAERGTVMTATKMKGLGRGAGGVFTWTDMVTARGVARGSGVKDTWLEDRKKKKPTALC